MNQLHQLQGPAIDWASLSPLLVMLGTAVVLLAAVAITPPWPRRSLAFVTVAASIATFVLACWQWRTISVHGSRTLVSGALRWDHFTIWVIIAVALAVAVSALVTDDFLHREGLYRLAPEIYTLYLLAGLGATLMGAANDLIVLFLGLEILSLSLYVLASSNRRQRASQESGFKYFVLGGVASAMFLYGVALVYGAAGSTSYPAIVSAFDGTLAVDRSEALVLAGVALLMVGMGFKAAAVPFHFWTPDVYQGAPTPVTGFMASAAKVGAFVAILRVLIGALPHWSASYRPVVWVLAVLSVVVGAVMAVVQTNVKRMLAFSSVSHAGFIMVGVEAAVGDTGRTTIGSGVPSVMLYLLMYSALVLGTFAVVSVVGRTGDQDTSLSGFRGLSRSHPALAVAMTILLVAQAGVPFTTGFIAKFGVIRAAVDERSYVLAVIAMIGAVIAAFLYLRIMISMWVEPAESGDDAREAVRVPLLTNIAIWFCVVFTVAFGVFPGWLVDLSHQLSAR